MSKPPPPAEGASPQSRLERIAFTVDEQVAGLGVTGMYFVMGGLTNLPSNDEFDELLEHTLSDLEDTAVRGHDLKADPVLAGYRQLHSGVQRSNRDHVASAENLLRLIRMNGTVTRVNLLVDICNLVSLRTRLSISVHDLASVQGDVRLSLTTGQEKFFPINAGEPKAVASGEYAYVDGSGEIIYRMETRQAAKTKVDLTTTECFYIVQGNPATEPEYVSSAAEQLISLTQDFCGGNVRILRHPWTP
jgi:DNA/RNA-binding domain of Phe-tRNA-synthetase-like protein